LDFGGWLVTARRRKNISQNKLAQMTGLTRTYISKVEAGAKVPSRNFVCLVLAHLDPEPEEREALLWAAAYSKRRIDLGRGFGTGKVALVNFFVECVQHLDALGMKDMWSTVEAAHPHGRNQEDPAM